MWMRQAELHNEESSNKWYEKWPKNWEITLDDLTDND